MSAGKCNKVAETKNPMDITVCGHNNFKDHDYYCIECQDGSVCEVCDECFAKFDLQLLSQEQVKEYYGNRPFTTDAVSRFATTTDLLRHIFGMNNESKRFKGVEKMESMSMDFGQKNSDGTINPFCQDAYHMGTYIGKNVCVMYPNHATEECQYMIVVNTRTGERLKIHF